MTGSISSRPIAGSSFGDGVDLDDEDVARDVRRVRQRVLRNRYSGVGDDAPVEEAKPTPIYDALSDEEKATVDRLIVGYRMSKPMEIA